MTTGQALRACVDCMAMNRPLRTGLAPPYLLVGHSIGGQYQFAFARLFPGEVADPRTPPPRKEISR